eukprot:jgi/Bigna1/81793/fgenesh1_pg.84_\
MFNTAKKTISLSTPEIFGLFWTRVVPGENTWRGGGEEREDEDWLINDVGITGHWRLFTTNGAPSAVFLKQSENNKHVFKETRAARCNICQERKSRRSPRKSFWKKIRDKKTVSDSLSQSEICLVFAIMSKMTYTNGQKIGICPALSPSRGTCVPADERPSLALPEAPTEFCRSYGKLRTRLEVRGFRFENMGKILDDGDRNKRMGIARTVHVMSAIPRINVLAAEQEFARGGRTTNAAPSLFQILCNMRSEDEHILSPNSAALRVKGDENKTAAAKRSLGSQLESRYFASDITNESGASIDIGMEPDKSDAKVISRKKGSLSQQKTQCDRSIFCNKKRRVMRANHGKHSNSNKTSIDFRHSIVAGASPDTKLCPPIVEKRNETELDWESAALFQMPKSPCRKQRQQQDQQRLKAPPFLSVRIPKNASDNQSCKMVGNTDNNAENLAKEFIRQPKYDQQNKLRFHQEIKRKDLHNDAVSARNNR